MADNVTIIKGAPCDKWDEVQAVQNTPFVYIMSNGSRWAGEDEGDIAELLEVLRTSKLDRKRFGRFYSENPCHGAPNPKYTPWNPDCGEEPYIDGPRMYSCDGVVRFFGNFEDVSHVFHIDTNHKPTIDALIAAIDANIAKHSK
jgi:hypothetical protein